MKFPEGSVLAGIFFHICLDDALQCIVPSFEIELSRSLHQGMACAFSLVSAMRCSALHQGAQGWRAAQKLCV